MTAATKSQNVVTVTPPLVTQPVPTYAMTNTKTNANLLDKLPGISQRFFGRVGGISKGLYAGLNCGFGSGDEQADIEQNRAFVAKTIGTDPARLITAYQHHSADVIVANSPWRSADAPKADGIVTSEPNLAIGILTADCAPVLLADPQARIVGAAHAGWQGAIGGIVENTVWQMERLGAKRRHIHAVVGPCISRDAYEVGPEFEKKFRTEHVENTQFFTHPAPGARARFDLSAYVESRLKKAGITNFSTLGHCTYERESLYYSYRRSVHKGESDYGRQISAIMLA